MCQSNEKGLTHLQEVSCALLRQWWWKPSFFKQVKAIKKNCDARWDLTHSYLLIYLHPQHQLNTECFNQLHMLLITDDDDVLLPSCHPELDWFYTLSINSATLSKILLPLLQVQVSQSILLVMGIDEISSITVPLSILLIGPIYHVFPYWLFPNFLCGKKQGFAQVFGNNTTVLLSV